MDDMENISLDDIKRSPELHSKKPLLKQLQNLITPYYATSWKEIGLQLGIAQGILQTIETNFRTDAETCCTEMLTEWLDTDVTASWGKLIQVVYSPAVTKIINSFDKSPYDRKESIESGAVAELENKLKEQHIVSRYKSSQDDWFSMPEHFTSVALIHQKRHKTKKEIIAFANMHLKGNVTESGKITTDIAEIFKSVERNDNSYTLLIEGAPGIGKTILTKEIVFQWAKGSMLKNEKLVCLIYLRDPKVKTLNNFESFINYISYSRVSKDVEQYVCKKSGKGICLVFDGYDEYPEELRNSSFLSSLINHKVLELQLCNIVITSRPSASACLHNIVDLRVEILGFTKEHRKSYIMHALKDNPNAIQDLLEYLESSYSVDAYCHIPLSMAILVFLFKESGYDKNQLPTTQTEINYKFICITIRRFIKRSQQRSVSITKFSEVPATHRKILLEISNLAFTTLKDDKIVFSASEIKHFCPSLLEDQKDWNGLDLLKAVQYFSLEENTDELSFNFLHFSVQELLAAYHISLMSETQQIKLLKETFWNVRYFNVWIMYVALTKDQPFAFKHFLSGNRLRISTKFSIWWSGNANINIAKKMKEDKIKCLHLFQCFTEAGNDDMCQYVGNLLQDGRIDLSGQALSAIEMYTLSSFLARCVQRHWSLLDLSNCYLDDENFERFCKSYASLTKSTVYINTVNLSSNVFTKASASQIANLALNFNVKQLVFASNELKDIGLNQAAFVALLECPNLVESRCIKMQDDNQINIVLYKRSSNTLVMSELFMVCYCTVKTYKDVYLFIENNSSFFEKFINTNNASIFKSMLHSLMNKMASISANLKLDVKSINITNKEVSNAISSLASNVPLAVRIGESHLPLLLSNISEKVIFSSLGTILFHGKFSIKTIHSMFLLFFDEIDLNQIYINGIALYDLLMNVALSKYTSLNSLQLQNCYVHDVTTSNNAVANILSLVLSNTTLLEHLNLSGCRLKTEHTKIILEALTQVVCIVTISLSDNNLAYGVFDLLASVITCNRGLKCIVLSNCNLQEAGILSITKALENCEELRSLDFSNNVITDDVAVSVAMLFEKCKSIQDLRLQNCQLQYVGIQKIAEAMVKNTCLHFIDLSSNCISNQNAMFIACVIANNNNVQKLAFSNCKLQSTGCQQLLQAMAKITSLVHLDFSNNLFTDVTVDNFALMIHQNVSLEYLNISGCCDKATDFEKITHSLVTLKSLTHLDLSCNVINITSAENIVIIIANNTFLEDLNLSKCEVHKPAFLKILGALQTIHHLKYLHLNNISVGYDEATGIAAVISNNPFLENIDFNHNLTEKEMKIILSSLRNHTLLKHFDISSDIITDLMVNDIVDVIDSNTQLTHLNISDTNIEEYKMLKIFKAVQRLNTLKSIKICNCVIGHQAAQAIADAISVNCMMEELIFTNNNFHEVEISVVFDVLRKIHTMKCLTIASSCVVNPKNIIEVTEVVSSNYITHFDLSNCYLEKSGCSSILNSLTPQAPVLQHINLSGNNLSGTAETITQLISVSYYLQHVNLANTLMQDEEVMMIIKAMQNINSLHCVNFTSYSINDELAVELQNTVNNNLAMISFRFSKMFLKETKVTGMTLSKSIFNIVINLQEITICFTDCENKQVATAVTLIKNNPYIKYLHLENCSLLEIDISSIIVALSTTTTLVYFCLTNFVITDNVDDGIATVLENNIHLEYFKLVACKLTGKGLTKSIQSFNFTSLSHLHLSKLNYVIINTTKRLQRPICDLLTHLTLSDVCLDATTLSRLSLPALTELQNLDLSHNPLTDESANILSSVILNNNGLRHLDLCDCKLQSEGINDIFNALQKISITYLDMSLNMSDTSLVLLQTVLPCLKHIEYLYLPYFELEQAEIDKIFDFISNDTVDLKFIDFGPNDIPRNMVWDLKNIVFVSKGNKMFCLSAEGIERVNFTDHEIENVYHSLDYLNVNNVTVDDEVGNTVALLIVNSPELENLEIFRGDWTVSSAVKCFSTLQNNSHLTFLKFRNNRNNKHFSLTEILYLLSSCTALRVLDLHNCCKSERTSIASITIGSPTFLHLNHLDLSNNYIDDEAVDYLTVLITNNVGLEYLNFCKCSLSKYNPNAKLVKIMQSIAKSLKNLLHIDFSHLRCSREVVQHITTVITCNTKLKHVNLCNCQLFAEDVENICQAAKKLTTLEYFNLSNNQLTSSLANKMTTLITNNKYIKVLSLPVCTVVINDKQCIKVFLNTVTDIFVKDMLTLFTNKTVSELNLVNCTLNNDQLKVVCNAVKNFLLPCVLFTINEIMNQFIADLEDVVENKSTIQGFKKAFKLLVIRDMSVHHGFDLVKLKELHHLSIFGCTFDVEEWNILKKLVMHNATTLDALTLSDCQLYGKISDIVRVCMQLSYLTLINVNIGASLSDSKPSDFKSQLYHLKTISISSMNFTKQMTVDVLSILHNSENLDQLAMVKCNVPAYGDSGMLRAFFASKNLMHLDLSSSQISSEIVDCILTENNKLTHIKFASCKFDKKGVFQICNRLHDLYNIVYLNINNNDNICFYARNIAAIISQNINLIHIEMAGCNFDTNGIIEIGNSLSSTIILQYINLSHNTIAGRAVDAVVPVLNRLKHINLRKCGLTSDSSKSVIMALTRNHSLKSVDLSLNEMAEDSVVDIAAMIANNNNIEVLCLPDCVTSAGSINNGNFLSPFYSLSHYMLSSIFDPIKRARSLKCVEFGLCRLDDSLASEVAALTASNSSLKKLKFSKLVLTHNGFKQLGNSILIIEGLNSISITGVHFADSDADNLATLINNNKSLQSFDISNCVMSEKGKNIIFEAMINLASLKSLNLKNIVNSDTIEDKVLFVIANNTSLEYLEVTGCEINTAKLCKVTSSLSGVKVISK